MGARLQYRRRHAYATKSNKVRQRGGGGHQRTRGGHALAHHGGPVVALAAECGVRGRTWR